MSIFSTSSYRNMITPVQYLLELMGNFIDTWPSRATAQCSQAPSNLVSHSLSSYSFVSLAMSKLLHYRCIYICAFLAGCRTTPADKIQPPSFHSLARPPGRSAPKPKESTFEKIRLSGFGYWKAPLLPLKPHRKDLSNEPGPRFVEALSFLKVNENNPQNHETHVNWPPDQPQLNP